MTDGDGNRLEEQMIERFLDGLDDDPAVSEAIVEMISNLSGEDDFGGRERLEHRVLEVSDIDAD